MAFLVRCFRYAYRALVRFYPRDFRQRFGPEMEQVFSDRLKQTQGARGLLWLGLHTAADWLTSAIREGASSVHATRPVEHASDGAPFFYLYGSDRPRTGALINGGVLSIFVFALISLLIGIGVNHRRILLVGSHHPSRSHILQANSTAEPVDLQSEIKVRSYPDLAPIEPYFKALLVLGALDTDQDNVISAAEIANARSVLRKLDKDRDGSLSPEECGLNFGKSARLSPELEKRAALRFMQFHPAHAALDVNKDGSISPQEIKNAPAALKTLDSNRDGALTLDELLPKASESP